MQRPCVHVCVRAFAPGGNDEVVNARRYNSMYTHLRTSTYRRAKKAGRGNSCEIYLGI